MTSGEFLQSKKFRGAVKSIVAVLVLAFVFTLGIFIGTEKARFSYSWGEHYFRVITGPNPNIFFPDRVYLNAHGTFGTILDINGSTLVVKNTSGLEKNVAVSNGTIIRQGPMAITVKNLRTHETVAVIGEPGSGGEINAVLIRVLNGSLPLPFASTTP